MSARFCMKCGGENPPGAVFCQYCGAPMASVPSAPPLATAPVVIPPPPGAWTSGPTPTAPPPRRRRWVRIVVVVVVVVIVLGVIGFLLLPPAPSVTVTQINFVSPNDVCGLNNIGWQGYTSNTSEVDQFGFPLTGNNTTGGATASCTVHTVSTSTSGFSVTGNVPLYIPANTTEILWVNITEPGSSYNGALTLVLT
jgi:hypothetical protein